MLQIEKKRRGEVRRPNRNHRSYEMVRPPQTLALTALNSEQLEHCYWR